MVGRELGDLFPPKRRCCGVGRAGPADRAVVDRRPCSRCLDRTEGQARLSALAGMVGAGRSELALGLFGALPISSGASISKATASPRCRPPGPSGLAWVWSPRIASRRGSRCYLDIAANITGPALDEVTKRFLIDKDLETAIAEQEITRYRIACRGPQTPVATMSGGNQQKVIVARWAQTMPHRPDPRRADARRRCRGQGGDLSNHA